MYTDLKRYAIILVSLAVMATAAHTSHGQKINKWVDENGTIHYGQQPPANVTAERIKGPAKVTPSPTATRTELVLYTAEWCGYCRKARNYLNDRGISYVEKDIEKDRFANLEFRRFGGGGIPLLVRDGEEKRRGFSVQAYDSFLAPR